MANAARAARLVNPMQSSSSVRTDSDLVPVVLSALCSQVGQCLLFAYDVTVLRIHVEEVCLMRRFVAITAGLAHHDRNEPVAACIDAARADAAARGQSSDKQRVDSPGRQC